MDRGLEEHGRERDGHAEQRREHERPDVSHRLRVAHGRTLLRPSTSEEEAASGDYVVTVTPADGPLTLPAASRARTVYVNVPRGGRSEYDVPVGCAILVPLR